MQVITDCKRNQTHPHEDGDCFVRALSVALEIKYPQAHDLLRYMGRIDRFGCLIPYHIRPICELLNLTLEEMIPIEWTDVHGAISGTPKYDISPPTLEELLREKIAKGNWIAIFSGHALAIKDGVIFDRE